MNTLRSFIRFLFNFGFMAIICIFGGVIIALNSLSLIGVGMKVVPFESPVDIRATDIGLAVLGVWISSMSLRVGVYFWTRPDD